MDVYAALTSGTRLHQIKAVGMHTAGEPTRIIIEGFPPLSGSTLLEKRTDTKNRHDDIRKRLMFEPRGHNDMYGAILVQETELVQSGQADIGVLFCHNEGFSTMCGHATLALGRFLVDTTDIVVFPKRNKLKNDESEERTSLVIHAPCGPVYVSIPIIPGTAKSEPSRCVWFLSVPSFATAKDLVLCIPNEYAWPQLLVSGTNQVKVDVTYGGAFYIIVSPLELGFSAEALGDSGLEALNEATRLLKAYFVATPENRKLLRHPTSPNLEYLYGVIVVDVIRGNSHDNQVTQEELGVCFFADQQIDRSPCGSGVSARVALAMARGELQPGVSRIYHSLVTKRYGADAFMGSAVERVLLEHDGRHVGKAETWEAWVIKVEGKAYYTDAATFVIENEDQISTEGFVLY